MPAFEPTKQQKAFVSAMVGLRMTHEEIASVIHDQDSERPISIATLRKYFQHELDTGKQKLKSLINTKLVELVNAGDRWAIGFGLKNVCGFREDQPGVSVSVGGEEGSSIPKIEVSFVAPTHREDD